MAAKKSAKKPAKKSAKGRKLTAKHLAAIKSGSKKFHAFVKAQIKAGHTRRQAFAAWKAKKPAAAKKPSKARKPAAGKPGKKPAKAHLAEVERNYRSHLAAVAVKLGLSKSKAKQFVTRELKMVKGDLQLAAAMVADDNRQKAAVHLQKLAIRRSTARAKKQGFTEFYQPTRATLEAARDEEMAALAEEEAERHEASGLGGEYEEAPVWRKAPRKKK